MVGGVYGASWAVGRDLETTEGLDALPLPKRVARRFRIRTSKVRAGSLGCTADQPLMAH